MTTPRPTTRPRSWGAAIDDTEAHKAWALADEPDERSGFVVTQSAARPQIDFLDPQLWLEPGRFTSPLVEQGHVAAHLPATGSEMFFRHREVAAALNDARLGAMGTRAFEALGWNDGPFVEWMRRNIVSVDPPAHTRLRSLVNRAFTPRRIEALAPTVRRVARELALSMAERSQVDLYESFAQRLPLQIILQMLGIPDVDHAQMQRWTEAINVATGLPRPEARAAADAAVTGMTDYVTEFIAERRKRPGDDLLSGLIEAEEDGERLLPEELPVMVLQLLVAGHETTRNLIGNGLYCLLQHPDQLQALRRAPSALPGAVEEMLRFEPPLIWVARTVREDFEISGVPVRQGQLLLLNLAAANRDPAVHPDPHSFDISRSERRILTFGYGAHFCIGANLARLEGRIAFEVLLERFSSLEFDGEPPRFAAFTALRTLEAFPLRVIPAN